MPGELTKNPLSSKASAQTVSLQVVTSSARGTFVLDFTLAGKDAVETRDRVKDALVRFLAPPMPACHSLLPGGSAISAEAWSNMTTDIPASDITTGLYIYVYIRIYIYKYIYNMYTSDDSTHTVNEVVRSIVVGGGLLPEDELLDLLALLTREA